MSTPVVLSYGMGVESTAILVRWLTDPSSRDFALSDLIVITAMTGDEWFETAAHVGRYVLPLMSQFGVRFVQVARKGRLEADGIVTLEDGRTTTNVHYRGAYRLSDELKHAATIPTSGGVRKCSQKYKGYVLDTWLADELDGEPYVHVLGFNAEELSRVEKDQSYGKLPGRLPRYPLVEWGWDRAACLAYLKKTLSVEWAKSCCTYCPFAAQGREREATLARLRADPEIAANVLVIEARALALNPRMTLYGKKSAFQVFEASGNKQAIELALRRFATMEWAAYHVRRAYHAPANAARSIVRITRPMSRSAAEEEVARIAGVDGGNLRLEGGFWRAWYREKAETFPCAEEFLVAAPFGIDNKEEKTFGRHWEKAIAGAPLRIAGVPFGRAL